MSDPHVRIILAMESHSIGQCDLHNLPPIQFQAATCPIISILLPDLLQRIQHPQKDLADMASPCYRPQ